MNCIRNERATRERFDRIGDGKELPSNTGVGWCGRDCSGEWVFLDAAHALGALAGGTGIGPCKLCLAVLRNLIDKELG